jgi:hypothetical protein
MPNVAEYRRLNTRKASALQVGGFRPSFQPSASNFGMTALGLPGEAWPEYQSRPMMFVCQLNLASAPARPPLLENLSLIVFFAGSLDDLLDREDGSNWVLRAYGSLDGLAPLTAPAGAPKGRKGFECLWQEVDDHPDSDDPELVPVPGARRPSANFENVVRTKIGGYASIIQSELWWDLEDHPANPKFCFQMNSEEKPGVVWTGGGTVYVARGTAPGYENRWYLDCQCL